MLSDTEMSHKGTESHCLLLGVLSVKFLGLPGFLFLVEMQLLLIVWGVGDNFMELFRKNEQDI